MRGSHGLDLRSLALAIVIIYRSTGVINFGQGEMAMFSTFIAWWLIADPAGPAHLWIGRADARHLVRRRHRAREVVIRPVEGALVLTIVMVTLGLGIALSGLAWIWGADTSAFRVRSRRAPSTWAALSSHTRTSASSPSRSAPWRCSGCSSASRSPARMRAAAGDRQASRLLGVRASWMLALGWGIAAMLGALRG